jgi:hypothetical protein
VLRDLGGQGCQPLTMTVRAQNLKRFLAMKSDG